MNYRIYENINGWELVDIVYDFEIVLKVVGRIVNDDINNFLVIGHDLERDMDIPMMCSINDYLIHKNAYEEEKRLKYTK